MGALSWNSWEFLGISRNFLVFRTRVVIVGNSQSEFAVKIYTSYSQEFQNPFHKGSRPILIEHFCGECFLNVYSIKKINFKGQYMLTEGILYNNCINNVTSKIWLLILLSSCYTFPCKLVMRIWCKVKIITSTWCVGVFSSSVCWIMYGYGREKLYAYHFWELKG